MSPLRRRYERVGRFNLLGVLYNQVLYIQELIYCVRHVKVKTLIDVSCILTSSNF